MNTFYFKAEIIGPYLPKNNQIIEDLILTDILTSSIKWVDGPTGLTATPSTGLNSVSLTITKKMQNGVEVIVKIKHKDSSIRVAYGFAEKQIQQFCALLSIAVKGGRYFYNLTTASIKYSEELTEVEGPPSVFLKNIAYQKQELNEVHLSFLNEAAKYVKSDSTLKNALDFFINGLEAEFIHSTVDEKALLSYYKVIEFISNDVACKNNLPAIEKNKQYEELINKVIKSFRENLKLKNKKKILRDACYSLRQIDDSVMSEKIQKASGILAINSHYIKNLQGLIQKRNKMLAHPELDINILSEEGDEFREVAKAFIKYYLEKYHHIDISELEKETIVGTFRTNADGYIITARYKAEHFK